MQMHDLKDLVSWLGQVPRNPKQTHSIYESDCEVVELDPGRYLATTVDSVSEEIAVGLYHDPYTMGWVAAQASLSDLAAVGARPTGILLSTQWGSHVDLNFRKGVAQGVSAALREAKTFLLGGDSGSAPSTLLTTVGIGTLSSKPLSRRGARPGDLVCVTGKTGNGPALAYRFLLGDPESYFPEGLFRPKARLDLGNALLGNASSVMDTSDGLLTSLNTLRIINEVEFDLEFKEETLSPESVEYCRRRGIPLPLLWLGEHGDFELLVTIPAENLNAVQSHFPELIQIGRVSRQQHSTVIFENDIYRVNYSRVNYLRSGNPSDVAQLHQVLHALMREKGGGWF